MMKGSYKHCENVTNREAEAAVSVTGEILKFWHSLFIECLCSLLNICAWGLEEKQNTNYKKKKRMEKNPKRGFSLLSVLGKASSRIFKKTIWQVTMSKICAEQMVCRPGFCIMSLRNYEYEKNFFCVFVELKKIYDQVIRFELCYILHRYGIGGVFLQNPIKYS